MRGSDSGATSTVGGGHLLHNRQLMLCLLGVMLLNNSIVPRPHIINRILSLGRSHLRHLCKLLSQNVLLVLDHADLLVFGLHHLCAWTFSSDLEGVHGVLARQFSFVLGLLLLE